VPTLTNFTGILFDVDLTLTNTNREVTPELKAALTKLAATDLHLGVCTGRAYVALKQYILPLFPPESLHITSGGSQIVDGHGKVIWQELLPEQTCYELHQLGQTHQQMYYLPTMEFGYASQQFIDKYQGLHNLIPPLKPISELSTWQTPFMVFVNTSPEVLEQLQSRTDVTVRTSVSTQNYTSVDITPKGVTKAAGIFQWCEHYHFSPEQVIGFGDSDNDLEFLDLVGMAVGMGNSTPSVLERVDRVIGHTDQNGLAVYLDTIMKGSQL
jgi:Cof subfamily protein (haloacid dehalogenase superfamily)